MNISRNVDGKAAWTGDENLQVCQLKLGDISIGWERNI